MLSSYRRQRYSTSRFVVVVPASFDLRGVPDDDDIKTLSIDSIDGVTIGYLANEQGRIAGMVSDDDSTLCEVCHTGEGG